MFRETQPEWVEVDVKRVRVERSRKFGGPWLGLELLRRLDLDRFLEETLPEGREEIPWPLMATVLVLGRLCDPSSELHLAERFYESSALPDLLSVPAEKVNEDRSVPGAGCAAAAQAGAGETPEGEARESCSSSTTTCCCTT